MTNRSSFTVAIMILVVASACIPRSDDPPIDLVVANIESTDETAVLRVTAVDKIETVGVYTTWEISADVERSIKGNLMPGSKVEYRRTIEGGGSAGTVGTRYLASFERSGSELRLPDVGYHFELSPALAEELELALSQP